MDGSKWSDEERVLTEHDSDDSPLLCNRYEKHRRHELPLPHSVEVRPRRLSLSVLGKLFLFSTAMIMFCVLMYIPVYNRASDQFAKGTVEGWTIQSNRDTKIYVQPKNLTTIYNPKNICDKHIKDKLLLLIVVCSAPTNFKYRQAIRQTWGNYKSYQDTAKIYHTIKQKYINYNFSYDLYPETTKSQKVKRDISGLNRLLPALAEALKENLDDNKTDVPEKRFDDEMLPEFDMNEQLSQNTEANYDYYDTNVMKIPPNGFESSPDVNKVLKLLKNNKDFTKIREKLIDGNTEPDFKVVFLVGLPVNDNDTRIQRKIDDEANKYGDVIQEGFIDSYNNLTIKSVMMLKWIHNNCGNGVRYILKTDDDMYVNMPNLVDSLRNRSRAFDAARGPGREYLLIGDLICGAKPVLDSNNKWFSPRYMYAGRVYPKYLSGMGYAMSSYAASALYEAALRTNFFHLEDIFITGMCAARAHPRITPRDDPLFSYPQTKGVKLLCAVHAHVTAHRIAPSDMLKIHKQLQVVNKQDECERMRLTKVRQDRLKSKSSPKKRKSS